MIYFIRNYQNWLIKIGVLTYSAILSIGFIDACDGILHKKEAIAIQQIAIDMGLNPTATKRILKMMKEAPNAIIDGEVLLNVFQEQHN